MRKVINETVTTGEEEKCCSIKENCEKEEKKTHDDIVSSPGE